MTPYRFDNQKKKKIISRARMFWTIFGVIVLVALLILLGKVAVQRIMRGPVWLAESLEARVSGAINLFTPKSILIERINELQAQVESDATNRILLQSIQYDYQSLQKAVNYIPEERESSVARVIGKPNRSLFNTIILDQGSSQEIQVGQLVIVEGTVALGRVSEVTAKNATVSLFSSPEFSGEVVIQNQNGITVPAEGKGSGNFEIHIPREIEVKEGDLLALPEDPLLTIGVVKSIQFDARDPFQTIIARTPVNVQELQFVEVAK